MNKPLTTIEKKKRLTMWMIIVFSILLAMTSGIEQFLTRLLFQIVLFSTQVLIVKSLLDDIYQ